MVAAQDQTKEEEQVYFLTVDWCKKGYRGIFCDCEGCCFRKDGKPHTMLEMEEILGLFSLILMPKSTPLTVEQVGEFTLWYPLSEYSNQFGVAFKRCDVPAGELE